MTSRKVFISMNSEAVSLMHEGKNNDASMLLREALGELKRPSATRGGKEISEIDMMDDYDEEEMHLESVSVFPDFLGLQNTSHDNVFPFYDRAFTLSQTPANQSNEARAIVTILYNLGLLYHSQALLVNSKTGQIDVNLFSQAREFYEAARKVAISSWSDDDFYDLYGLMLALANNLGHIYGQSRSQLYNFSRMNQNLSYLIRLVRYPHFHLHVSEEDNDFFYLSVFTFLDSASDSGLTISPAA